MFYSIKCFVINVIISGFLKLTEKFPELNNMEREQLVSMD